ncbi:CAMK family protein kinase [Tritrichomonas foetus]|uniref:CAMK family protein kinase n=1 Tax=Tritrichomonas foetus TaxID=1144522 RepID=A0A1J4JNW6_9EUKA|nr:CAMK family protein kinase [Tritrichomonas foetus]|eukprot:OHS99211.1 CAMK family protein kinase [Tritrichomonas foetus]
MDENGSFEIFLSETQTLRIPPVIGGTYEFVRCIGNGSNSAVILVRHKSENLFYAVKIVTRNLLIEENLMNRFEQEIRIMQHLHHPNIITLKEIVYETENIYIVMDYCENGELFSYIIDQSEVTEIEAKKIFRQIIEAVKYIHDRSIAHRDIKPENILLDRELNAKLCDFGLCHVTSPTRELLTPCGSPFYAPPEIVKNLKYDGKKADIWSLGIVLFTMVTGALPWTEIDPPERLYDQIQRAEIKVPFNFSLDLRKLILSMTDKDPTKRPNCDQILYGPWLFNKEHHTVNFCQSQINFKNNLNTRVNSSKSQPTEILITSFKTKVSGRSRRGRKNTDISVSPMTPYSTNGWHQRVRVRGTNEGQTCEQPPSIETLKRIVPSSGRKAKR